MQNQILLFSTPDVGCRSCVESIQNHISKFFNQSFDSFKLLNFFEYDLTKKTISLKVEINADKVTHSDVAQILIDTFALDQIAQEIVWIEDKNVEQHYGAIFFNFIFALFWMGISAGLWTLTPFFSVLAVAISIPSLVWSAKNFFRHAFLQFSSGLKDKAISLFNMDSLFVITGTIVAISSVLSLFFPFFPNLLEAGFLIFGFRHLGIFFQAYLDKKIGFSKSLVDMFQYRQYLLTESQLPVFARDLKVGQKITIKKGEFFPIDGILIKSTDDFEIRDMLDTGSYLTKDVSAGHLILAGSECMQGECEIEVTHSLQDSRLGRIDQSVLEIASSKNKTTIMTQVDTWMQWFIPGVLGLSLVSFLLVGQWYSLSVAINCAISVLVSACPCTLGLIIPMALRMGAYKSSVYQILFQSSEALQKAAEADVFVMDYNGTLTKGEVVINEFSQCNLEYQRTHLLDVIYTIEHEMLTKRPSHSLGKKIKEYIESEGETNLLSGYCEDFGYGGFLEINQEKWWFGNNQLLTHLKQDGIESKPHRLYLFCQKSNSSRCEMVGTFDYADPLKPHAKEFVQEMLSQGKSVKVCTGADSTTASYLAKELGLSMEQVSYNNRMPDKRLFFQQLKHEFPTQSMVMIGDAMNDREAFKECDLSIFINNTNNSGFLHESLKKSVDILVLSNELMDIALAFKIAQETMSVIQQNLIFSMIYNGLALLLAGGVFLAWGISLPPVIGVVVMILQSILLTLNAYRIMFFNAHPADAFDFENRNALTPT
jgi:Cu2+-exporting ATPase